MMVYIAPWCTVIQRDRFGPHCGGVVLARGIITDPLSLGPGVAPKPTQRALSSLCQLIPEIPALLVRNGSVLLALDGLAIVSLAANIQRSPLIVPAGGIPRRRRPMAGHSLERKEPIQEVNPVHRPPLIRKQYFSGQRLR